MARKTASKGKSTRQKSAPSSSQEQQTSAVQPLWRRWWLRLGLVLLLCGAIPLLAFYWFASHPVRPAEERLVVIQSGQSLVQIAAQLEEAQVVADGRAFRLLARVMRQGRLIQAGRYRFSEAQTPLQVLDSLVRGRVELQQCTLPEGMTAHEVVARCVQLGLGELQRYLTLLSDPDFRQKLSIEADSLEGYLFPETYRFAPGTAEERVLETMVHQMRRHLTEPLVSAAKKRDLNELQLLTLASIIQKEAGNEGEMPLISAVFHNRLRRGMPLQADPTVIYGISDFDGNLTRKHLRTPTPYNTYVHRGLPPGPIANPGLAALRAAANPAEKPYLYFVATGDGGHYFSRSLKEHNRAVRRYLMRRR